MLTGLRYQARAWVQLSVTTRRWSVAWTRGQRPIHTRQEDGGQAPLHPAAQRGLRAKTHELPVSGSFHSQSGREVDLELGKSVTGWRRLPALESGLSRLQRPQAHV